MNEIINRVMVMLANDDFTGAYAVLYHQRGPDAAYVLAQIALQHRSLAIMYSEWYHRMTKAQKEAQEMVL